MQQPVSDFARIPALDRCTYTEHSTPGNRLDGEKKVQEQKSCCAPTEQLKLIISLHHYLSYNVLR